MKRQAKAIEGVRRFAEVRHDRDTRRGAERGSAVSCNRARARRPSAAPSRLPHAHSCAPTLSCLQVFTTVAKLISGRGCLPQQQIDLLMQMWASQIAGAPNRPAAPSDAPTSHTYTL